MEIKDSGKTREFGNGCHRDLGVGKGRTDQLPFEEVWKAYLRVKNEDVNGDTLDVLKSAFEKLCSYMKNNRGKLDFILTGDSLFDIAKDLIVAAGIDANNETHDVTSKSEQALFSYGVIEVSKHYEAGALKYGENNWMLGMPVHVYLDSATRHLLKALAGMKDEPHIRASAWNILCCAWTIKNLPNYNDCTIKNKQE